MSSTVGGPGLCQEQSSEAKIRQPSPHLPEVAMVLIGFEVF